MQRTRCLLFGAILVVGCASGRGGSTASFQQNVGIATAPELAEMANRVLALHQFEIEDEEGPPNILVRTRWLARTPYPDEQALAIEAAQVRVTIHARPRSLTSRMGEVYSVQMSVEQRIQRMGSTEWMYQTHTAQARAHAERIVEDLRQLLDVGVRRH